MSRSIFDEKSLAFCLLLPVFLLFADIPLWAFASSIIFWFYRLILDRSGWRIPSRWITGLFSLIFMIITLLSYKTLIGREASCTFIVILLGLKILEYRQTKERGFLVFLGLYLLSAKFLFDTELIWFSVIFPAMVLLIYHLLPDQFRKRSPKLAGTYALQSIFVAIPFGLFLFFYFPRFSSSMFDLQSNQNQVGSVGFAEDVHPGSMASLIENDEIAFRAEFLNLKPTINTLYWRGLTLTKSDDLHWTADPAAEPNRIMYQNVSPDDPQAQITLEPNAKLWLFSLEETTAISSDQMVIYGGPLGTYRAETSIDKRVVYKIKVQQNSARPSLPQEPTIQTATRAPADLRDLLQELSQGTTSTEEVLQRLSNYFVSQQFQYTLQPGDTPNLTLSDFLLRTRKGYCEHFASASALLLNFLKIPTRVVVGYHGGEYNPVGKFWTVRQRDAHAWVEYLDNKQWRRFDPTAVIAPLRLALGSLAYEQAQERLLDPETLQTLESFGAAPDLWEKSRYFIDNLNYRWHFAFVNFDLDKQRELLREMDINLGFAILLGVLFTLVFSLLLSWLFRTHERLPRSQRIFRIINRTMEPYDLEKKPQEGILEWKQRLESAFPSKRLQINTLIDCYVAEAYENKQSRINIIKAKQIASSFR